MIGLLLAAFGPAYAASSECAALTLLDVLTCSSEVSGRITSSTPNELSSSATRDAYTCGSPFAPLTQPGGDNVYAFSCLATGSVPLQVRGLDCDLDIYILGDTCDPTADCLDGSTAASTTTDSVTFDCTAGETYYVAVEGYGYTFATGTGACRAGDGAYTLSFDVSRGTGCPEDCDDGLDNDSDGDIDCDDSDCAGDPVCCDVDHDGYNSEHCGGGDCDDSDGSTHPGAAEGADGVDDDCDGTVDEGTDWYDDDGDGFTESGGDCDDGNASVNPAMEEVARNGLDDNCDGTTS